MSNLKSKRLKNPKNGSLIPIGRSTVWTYVHEAFLSTLRLFPLLVRRVSYLALYSFLSDKADPASQASRGTLSGREEPNDPRQDFGWKAAAATASRPPEETPWMSVKEQQPFFGHWQENEA